MTERPILFSAPMVRAIRDDSKKQTRRIVKPQPAPNAPHDGGTNWIYDPTRGLHVPVGSVGHLSTSAKGGIRCPYGQPGDRLWVRETWDWRDWSWNKDCRVRIAYAADGEQADKTSPVGWRPTIYNYERWRPSIHMPRWASRITLEVLGVRVERLQDISEEDARAEGVALEDGQWTDEDGTLRSDYRTAFRRLWISINGQDSWDANPWVWVVEFRRLP